MGDEAKVADLRKNVNRNVGPWNVFTNHVRNHHHINETGAMSVSNVATSTIVQVVVLARRSCFWRSTRSRLSIRGIEIKIPYPRDGFDLKRLY
jgi:hypothetical protein